jgi:hypothetical protein
VTRFAEGTTVSVVKSRIEIEELVKKHGARHILSGDDGKQAWIAFAVKDRFLRFTLPLPDPKDRKFTQQPRSRWRRRSDEQIRVAVEAETRRRWRALLLALKAKFEIVESEISTFEHEFLSHFVLPDKRTIGEVVVEMLDEVVRGGLPALPAPKDTIDGEVVGES